MGSYGNGACAAPAIINGSPLRMPSTPGMYFNAVRCAISSSPLAIGRCISLPSPTVPSAMIHALTRYSSSHKNDGADPYRDTRAEYDETSKPENGITVFAPQQGNSRGNPNLAMTIQPVRLSARANHGIQSVTPPPMLSSKHTGVRLGLE